MYAGFVTPARTIKVIGIHQRFDMAAYRMITTYLMPGSFPTLKEILHFEGINGPDGIKIKSLGVQDPSHMYDPINDIGELPKLIDNHYQLLVEALRRGDMVRAAYDASWMAHYVTDGLTPAHHYPYDEMKEEVFSGISPYNFLHKSWLWLGGKGVLSTHINFEMGVASTLLLFPIKTTLDDGKLAEAWQIGALEFFKQEAREVAKLKLYDKFYKEGWTADLARTIRQQIAPHAIQVVGIIWLLAYLDAGQTDVIKRVESELKARLS